MRLKKWKSFLSIFMASALMMSTAAYGNPVVITPLEESQVASFQSGSPAQGQGPDGSYGSSGTGSVGGGADSAGVVSSTGPSADNTNNTNNPSSPSGPSQTADGTAAGPEGAGSSTGVNPGNGTGVNQGTNQGTVDTASIQQPAVEAEGAVLMDAATGNVLFSKNGDTKFYPASITKLMTALLVAENCGLDDKVTFSATATTNLESGAVSINMVEGDVMTVRQCLYALLLKSANEVGNALAEHVAGSNAKFAEMMNAKAAALGCTNTHFTNPHGLNDTNHYTTPMIWR